MQNTFELNRIRPSSISRLLLFLCAGLGMHRVSAQVSVTATAGTAGPTNYTTVNAAFDAVNAGTHQGAIQFLITGNTTEPATPSALVSTGTGAASYTSLSIRPQGDRIISGLPSGPRAILQFNGADNVTIDGDDPGTPGARNLTIQASSPSAQAGIGIVRFASATASSDGATNNTLRNCNIIGSRSMASSTLNSYGIYVGSSGSGDMFNTGSSWNVDGLTLENNSIRRCFYGIYFAGNTAGPADGLVIQGNELESPSAEDGVAYRGILLRHAPGALVKGNRISMWTTGGNTGPAGGNTVVGIHMEDGNTGAEIDANRIEDLLQGNTSTSLGAYGILISSATSNSNIRITNNFIRDIRNWNTNGAYTFASSSAIAVGIRVTSNATGLQVLHNTISLDLPNTNSGQPSFSACLQYTTNVSGSVVRNNIFSNTQTSGISASRHFAVLVNSNAALGTLDHNAYSTPGATNFVAYNGADRATLAAWTPAQTGSIDVLPPFVSSTDLHLDTSAPTYSSFEGAGLSGIGVTTDIDGDQRPEPPTLGADESGCAGPVPTATISGAGTYCSNQLPDVVFTFTGTPPFDFTYTNGSTSVPVTGHPTSVFTIAGAAAGSYSVTSMSDALACTAAALGGVATVVVVQAPNPGVNGTLTVCSSGQPASLFAVLGAADGGGVWSGPSPVSGGLFDPATMVAGVYTYTLSGTAPCIDASATVTAVVDPCLGIEDREAPFGIRWSGQDLGGQHGFVLEGALLQSIEVRDAMGRLVQVSPVQQAGDRWSLDLAGQATGAYVLLARTDRGVVWTKLVHEKR
jgi:hypothetical protein